MYIKEENGKVVVYDVNIDKKIKEIKKELIKNFSEITTYEEEVTSWYNGTYKTNEEMIEVLDYTYTGKMREYNDFYSEDEPIYLVQFRKYKYPKLVIYINEFLEGDFSNLPRLKEMLIPKKLYRVNDDNRDDIAELVMQKDYIKSIIECINIVRKEYVINSLSDVLEMIKKDESLKESTTEIREKLYEDNKTLSYLKED